jgi:tetratricopeptide (TPR) repeat protein
MRRNPWRQRLPIAAVCLLAVMLAALTWRSAADEKPADEKPAAELWQAGRAAAAEQDSDRALGLFEQAVTAEPDNLRYGTDYRQAAIAAGQYDRCLELFEKLVVEHPGAANAHMNLGFAHVDKIPVEGAITGVILANEALGHFTDALELEETWLGHYTRGNSYLFWPAIFGRTQNGIDDLERAIEMAAETEKKPYHARAWAALGDGYWRLEDVDKARETWSRSLEMFPDNQELQDRLSRQGADLDAFLEEHFETTRRVATDLREIWGAE